MNSSLLSGMTTDVWIHCIVPYLLFSDQCNLAQVCRCVKAKDEPLSTTTILPPNNHQASNHQNATTSSTNPSSSDASYHYLLRSLALHLSPPRILSRVQKRIVKNMHESTLAVRRHFQLADEAGESSAEDEEQFLKDALREKGVKWNYLVFGETQSKYLEDEPLALNFAHLFMKCLHWRHLGYRAPENELEEMWCSVHFAFEQLKCGLVLPTETFRAVATHLRYDAKAYLCSQGSSSTSSGSSASSKPTVLPKREHAIAALSSLRIIGHFEIAVQRLLPIQRALVSMNAQWTYWNGPFNTRDVYNERVGGFQITPFIVAWPKSAREFIQEMKKFDTSEVTGGRNDNESAEYGDEQRFDDSSEVRPLPCGGESHPEDQPQKVARRGWICSHECAISHSWNCGLSPCNNCHFGMPGIHRGCLCHTQLLRGCVWWHCERATHWVRRLLIKRLGMQGNCEREGADQSAFPKARSRPDWSGFFAVNPAPPQKALEELPVDRAVFQPIDPSHQISQLLQEAFPWSIDVNGVPEDYLPTLGLVAAPLSDGWVGGFLGTTVMSAHP